MSLLHAVRRPWWLLILPLIFSACAVFGPKTPEEAVRQRAQARWDALLAGQWSKAYSYMAPSYRALIPENRYSNQFGGGAAWVGAEVTKVTCADDRCTVRMKVDYRLIAGGRSGEVADTYFDETWIREEGQWWMFQKH